jgi:hypothetical protein
MRQHHRAGINAAWSNLQTQKGRTGLETNSNRTHHRQYLTAGTCSAARSHLGQFPEPATHRANGTGWKRTLTWMPRLAASELLREQTPGIASKHYDRQNHCRHPVGGAWEALEPRTKTGTFRISGWAHSLAAGIGVPFFRRLTNMKAGSDQLRTARCGTPMGQATNRPTMEPDRRLGWSTQTLCLLWCQHLL